MYYYLIDPLQYDGRNFELYQTHLLSLLGEYQISGETARVTKLRQVEDLVATALAHNAKTLVVVGGDKTLSEVIRLCLGKKITLAFIPLNSRTEVGKIIGITGLDQAIATIARRRVEDLDVARIGDEYFISTISFGPLAGLKETGRATQREKGFGLKNLMQMKAVEIGLKLDDSYQVTDKLFGAMIINARDSGGCVASSEKNKLGNPVDGVLDIVLLSKLSKFEMWRYRRMLYGRCFEALPGSSVMRAKKIEIILPEGLPLFLSGEIFRKSPAVIEMSKEKIRLVVGRERQF